MKSATWRAVAAVENTAAAILFFTTALSFAAVVARYVFNAGIPDAFDGTRYLLGVVVFWGMASACYRGEHITMDAVWSISPGPVRRLIDLVAAFCVTAALAFLLWKFSEKVVDTWNAGLSTVDLDLPVAAIYSLAWVGLVAAFVFSALRFTKLLRNPGDDDSHTAADLVD